MNTKVLIATAAIWLMAMPGTGEARTWLSTEAPPAWHEIHAQTVVAQAVQLQNHLNGILKQKCQATYTRNLAGTSLRVWVKRHIAAHKAKSICPARPPHYDAWLCIHRGEGAWNSNTGNGYYGGLQMDYGFMRTYGADLLARKGTADHWTPLEQMWVAEKAYQSGRGFYPWPNTARACGLI